MDDETGAVAAEFAVALPAVMAILIFSLSLVASQVQGARLEQDAAIAARAIGRGESVTDVEAWLKADLHNFKLTTSQEDGILCAMLKQRLSVGITLPSFVLDERSCVWVGETVPQ